MNERKKYQLDGKNIYRDKKNQAIFFNKHNNIGYKISNDKEGMFQTLQLRYFIAVIVAFLIQFSIYDNYFISIGAGIVVAIVLEWRYRVFLSECNMIENYDPTNSVKRNDDFDEPLWQSILKLIVFIFLAVALIVNGLLTKEINSNRLALFASFLAAAFSVFLAIRICIYIKNKK